MLVAMAPCLGCVPPDASTRHAYEDCSHGLDVPCGDGVTLCLGDPVNEAAPFDDGAGICSVDCVTSDDCPPHAGARVVCETFAAGAVCVIDCEQDDTCPDGTTCDSLDRGNGETVHRCTP